MSPALTQARAKQAHRRIAMFLGIFLLIHFATHFAALDSIAAQALVLEWGRRLYRIPAVEIALIAAFAAQVILGIRLLWGIKQRKKRGAWHWAQFLSGAYLAYFIVLHSAAALLSRFLAGLDTNFFWPAGTLILTPLKYLFAPYYTIAIMALVTHLVSALHFRGPQSWHRFALLAGPVSAVAILLAYAGMIYPVELPQQYLDYFEGYGSLPAK